jgi:hypothetical protein
MLLGSYYILRPVRDAMSTVLGVQQLPNVYIGTLVLTLLASPAFAWLMDTFKVSRVLPGVFAFLIVDLLGFYIWMNAGPLSQGFAVTFYWWFSVVNLFMISVFFSLMVDTFTPAQASRLLPMIAAGGSLGASRVLRSLQLRPASAWAADPHGHGVGAGDRAGLALIREAAVTGRARTGLDDGSRAEAALCWTDSARRSLRRTINRSAVHVHMTWMRRSDTSCRRS